VYYTNSLNYSNDHTGKLGSNYFIFYLGIVQRAIDKIMHHYSVKLETVKQTITTSKHSIEFTHSKLSCHLKMNRDKLVFIIGLWKSENGKRLTITTNSFMKTDHLDKFSLL